MRVAAYLFAAALVLLAGVVGWTVVRGEDTRDAVQRVTVDPCKHPRSDACQRRIRLVLRELVRRHPDELRRLGLKPRPPTSTETGVSGGGGAGSAPSGGGPVGRVPSPGSPPEPNPPSSPPPSSPPADEPALNLDAPLVPKVCVGDLVGVNC